MFFQNSSYSLGQRPTMPQILISKDLHNNVNVNKLVFNQIQLSQNSQRNTNSNSMYDLRKGSDSQSSSTQEVERTYSFETNFTNCKSFNNTSNILSNLQQILNSTNQFFVHFKGFISSSKATSYEIINIKTPKFEFDYSQQQGQMKDQTFSKFCLTKLDTKNLNILQEYQQNISPIYDAKSQQLKNIKSLKKQEKIFEKNSRNPNEICTMNQLQTKVWTRLINMPEETIKNGCRLKILAITLENEFEFLFDMSPISFHLRVSQLTYLINQEFAYKTKQQKFMKPQLNILVGKIKREKLEGQMMTFELLNMIVNGISYLILEEGK